MKRNLFIPKTALAFLMALFSVWGWGQMTFTATNFTQTQDFDGLPLNATNNSLSSAVIAQNWYRSNGSTQSQGLTGIVVAGANTGSLSHGVYNCATSSSSTDRAVGAVGSGSGEHSIGVMLVNNTGRIISGFNISGMAEKYRNGTNAVVERVIFEYSLNATSLNNGTWTAVSSLDLIESNNSQLSANSGVDGNLAENKQAFNGNVTGLNLANNGGIWIRWSDTDASGTDALIALDDVSITAAITTTWSNGAWNNGDPTTNIDAIIGADYSGASFTANNLTVNAARTLTIGSGIIVTAGSIINNGNIIVNDNGNLIQTGTNTYTAGGVSNFTVNKTGATLADKYVFWSSPVSPQNLANIYTGVTTPFFITEYNSSTDTFVNSSTANNATKGKGYSIKNPATNALVSFSGTPNNGDVSIDLVTPTSTPTVSYGYNLVGNPYPSDLNLGAFYTTNQSRISSTFYFWDTNSTAGTNPGYAVFNAANGANPTWISADGGTAANPTGTVAKIGQGFIVKATDNTPLLFNNSMRGAGTATFFNKNNASTEGKYWLRLSSSYNTTNTIAITYFGAASNAYDIYDSKALALGATALYTTADAEKLVIQGRGAFGIGDIVPVGTKHASTGNFTIALIQKEGIFDNGQAIYLHDKVLGTYTNLHNSSYNFTSNAGEITDRFEVVYQLGTLSTTEVQKGTFEIYRDGNDFYARNNKNIEKLEVFDASGRKVQEMNPASQLVRIPLDSKGFYIIKAKSAGKEYSKKITY